MEITNLDQVIGQDRPLKFIRGLLTDMKRFPNTVIVDGPHGVGKSSIISCLKTMVDNVTFIETTDINSVSEDIRSRACRIHLNKINQKDMVGYLMAICSKENIKFTLDGINRIVRKSQGDLRYARNCIFNLSKLGKIDKDLVIEHIENNDDEIAYKIFSFVATGDMKQAIEIGNDLVAKDVISSMFSYYGKCFFDHDDSLSKEEIRIREAIKNSFQDVDRVTSVFLKWERSSYDALPLFLYELSKCTVVKNKSIPVTILKDIEPEPKKEIREHSVLDAFKGRIKVLGEYE